MAREGRPFYSKWVWKDWLAKTQDLDNHEYAAYHRLLTYAATTSPDLCSIPSDDKRLARITRTGLKRWKTIRNRVISFFEAHTAPDGVQKFVHNRLRMDAAQWFLHVEKQRRAACIRHSISNSDSDSNSKSTSKTKKNPEKKRPRSEHPAFPEWWASAPKRVDRMGASKAYDQAIREGATPELLLAGIRRYATEVEGREKQHIKHPETWLHKSWRDEPILALVSDDNPYAERQRRVKEALAKLEAENAAV